MSFLRIISILSLAPFMVASAFAEIDSIEEKTAWNSCARTVMVHTTVSYGKDEIDPEKIVHWKHIIRGIWDDDPDCTAKVVIVKAMLTQALYFKGIKVGQIRPHEERQELKEVDQREAAAGTYSVYNDPRNPSGYRIPVIAIRPTDEEAKEGVRYEFEVEYDLVHSKSVTAGSWFVKPSFFGESVLQMVSARIESELPLNFSYKKITVGEAPDPDLPEEQRIGFGGPTFTFSDPWEPDIFASYSEDTTGVSLMMAEPIPARMYVGYFVDFKGIPEL